MPAERLFFAMPGNEAFADRLARAAGAKVGALEVRSFPDGETYLRFADDLTGRDIAIVATLNGPDAKILQLLLAAASARELGARSVGAVCPYLAYLRQDARFRAGEGISSAYVARILSRELDWLATVDPHLHRWPSLAAIYTVPTSVTQAAPLLSDYLRSVPRPLVIGPDDESRQWARAVAAGAGAPCLVLNKVRRGDRDVSVSVPMLDNYRGYTPVLIDDIISTGRTMLAAMRHLEDAGTPAPHCVAVHAIFADDAYDALRAAGAAAIATTNTIPHRTNCIDVAPTLAAALVAGPAAWKVG